MATDNLCAEVPSFNRVQIIPPPLSDDGAHQHVTFAQAAEHYLRSGGEARYLHPIIAYFGDTPVKAIFPAHIKAMAEAIYPNHKGSTKNRQAVTPARAVLLHAYDHGWCQMIRVRRFKTEKPNRPKAASSLWLHDFIRQANKDGLPHVAAIVLFMATTGARVSEAIALEWPQVDLTARTALLLKTKTSTNSLRHLTDELAGMMRDLQAERHPSPRVFRYTSRHSVNERIKAICDRAGIEYKAPHTCGRRTFATRAIRLGMDVSTAMTAGGWQSSSVFLEIYVQARANAGRIVADRFTLDSLN